MVQESSKCHRDCASVSKAQSLSLQATQSVKVLIKRSAATARKRPPFSEPYMPLPRKREPIRISYRCASKLNQHVLKYTILPTKEHILYIVNSFHCFVT